jgi:hypothetical protein
MPNTRPIKYYGIEEGEKYTKVKQFKLFKNACEWASREVIGAKREVFEKPNGWYPPDISQIKRAIEEYKKSGKSVSNDFILARDIRSALKREKVTMILNWSGGNIFSIMGIKSEILPLLKIFLKLRGKVFNLDLKNDEIRILEDFLNKLKKKVEHE